MKFTESYDASNRLTVAVEGFPSLAYRFVRWKICRKFNLIKSSDFTNGINEKFQEYMIDDNRISIEWDSWSGFTVTAKHKSSEKLVREIGEWLKYKYVD